MYAAVRLGTPSFMSFPKGDEVSCEVRSMRSPIRSLTSLDRDSDENCKNGSATHP